ncbi:MAG: PIN domain-containing protein, partial [Prevotellaceae bacterium]|jgi:predicted nucleic acid-binding protein|nr:PIN domain-containing protein [Prevotellaceae bacterium]
MKQRIYLDNCCFNRPYDDQASPKIRFEAQAKLFIQGLVLGKEVELVWSYILKFENSKNLFSAKKNAIAQWEALSVMFVDASDEVVSLAESIVQTGVKVNDALHLACAITAGCSYCITVDNRMRKYRNDRIVICGPIEFLNYYFNYYE